MRNWTEEQQNAIASRGGSLLVSAAAGSGKTAVLVERVIQKILDPMNPVPADKLLVVTFSNGAAREMKQRISAKIGELMEQNPDNIALQRQQMLLDRAQISTIHSFCLELIRQNYDKLEISPDFRIADEKELEIMRLDAVAEVIEERYQHTEDSVFFALVELLSGGRDDTRLIQTILKLYEFIRSHPFYEDWLDRKLEIYSQSEDVCQSIWGKVILEYTKQSVHYAIESINQGIEVIITSAMDPYLEGFYSDLSRLDELAFYVDEHDWDKIKSALDCFEFVRLKAIRGFEDTATKDLVQGIRGKVKDLIKSLREKQFCATAGEFKEDIADLIPKIATLFSVTKEFGRHFDEAKKAKKVVDFSDLEHFALKLLVEKSEGQYVPTAFAKGLSENYDEIFIDEYQDTNEAQDMIFYAVSKTQENLFMVGDVKQSIYRFRQAMPEIFLEKKKRFAPYDGENFPAKISLGRNFRSRDSVTNGINFIFSMIMSEEIGELDYTHEEALIASAEYPDYDKAGWEVHLLDIQNSDSEEPPIQLEAAYVAQEIEQLITSRYQVNEGGELRDIRLSDICILFRSVKNKADIFLKELASRGIEANTDAEKGYLLCREIAAMISLLKVIDNPLLDIDLVAAMMSPIFSFTAEEVAKIKLLAGGKAFYFAVTASAEAGDEKSRGFLELLDTFRRHGAVLSTAELIRKIYSLTEFEVIAGAMPLGENRRDNLRLLVEYAAYYDKAGYKGLHSFVHFVDRLLEKGGDLSAPAATSQGGDAVKLMSIHRSKGLEFPVVFLADTSKKFNKEDLNKNTLLHSQMGFACVRRDEALSKQFTTIPMEAMKIELERSALSEEMRILYVALTRAKEKLIVTSLQKDMSKKLKSLSVLRDEKDRISPRAVRDGQSYMDWILLALLQHEDGEELRELAQGLETSPLLENCRFKVIIKDLSESTDREKATEEKQFAAEPSQELLAQFKAADAFVYPYEAATKIPTKMAVSQISKDSAESYRFTRRPDFMAKKGLTGAEKGNALHKFMQFCEYEAGRAQPEQELERLRQERYLSDAEAGSIGIDKLKRFFASPLAQRIFASAKVYREYKFLAEVGSDVIGDYIDLDLGDNKTAVQGVADCVFLEGDKAVIVDYKTDRVQTMEQLAEKYQVQLLLYKKILQESLGCEIKESIIYSLELGEALSL